MEDNFANISQGNDENVAYTSAHRVTCYLLNSYIPASIECVIRVSIDGYHDWRCSIEIDVH